MDHLSPDNLCKEITTIRKYLNGHGLELKPYFEYEHMVEVCDNMLNYVAKTELEKKQAKV